jgi:hypothetical protein
MVLVRGRLRTLRGQLQLGSSQAIALLPDFRLQLCDARRPVLHDQVADLQLLGAGGAFEPAIHSLRDPGGRVSHSQAVDLPRTARCPFRRRLTEQRRHRQPRPERNRTSHPLDYKSSCMTTNRPA